MQHNPDVTVILTVWKRNHLEEQVQALMAQSVPVKNVWIYQCGDHIQVADCLEKHPFLERVHSTINLKYFGRFSLAQHATSTYTWILDDDVIPSARWVETCINTSEKHNAIISDVGRVIIPIPTYFSGEAPGAVAFKQEYIGDRSASAHPRMNHWGEDTVVDFGCHGWFLRTEWLKHFWKIWPSTFENGEDIHLSAACKIFAGVATVVPRQTPPEICGNLRNDYGSDENASWTKAGFYEQRIGVVKHLIQEHGWEPLRIEQLKRGVH